MDEQELFSLLALQKVELVGDVAAKKLLQHFENASEIFQAKTSKLASISGIGTTLIKNLKDKSVFEKAEKEINFIKDHRINVHFYQDKSYPEKLKHCYDAPILLFSRGKINLQQSRIISIVGTRNVTSHGADFCKKFISDLAPLNPIIVSGFAYGVDIIAHQAAVENNLQTIGVLAHGLNQIYPKIHKKYCKSIEENGGFITEFWSSSNPDKENFVKRNRIVAGMTEATIVIESAEKGGSLITASLANDYNRDVFAVPGRISDKYSLGCNNLIKSQKANLLTSAADLVYMLNWDIEKPSAGVQKQLFIDLLPDEQKVYDFLLKSGKVEMDEIALNCGFPIFSLSAMLLNMELKGIVRPLPGKLFEAI